jgi:hypothetical protein
VLVPAARMVAELDGMANKPSKAAELPTDACLTIIGDFPGEPYKVLKPIPVMLEWTGSAFLARFGEANIAMTGDTSTEALGNLAADVLDTYEDYSAEADTLGPEPARQLAVLRQYIAKR